MSPDSYSAMDDYCVVGNPVEHSQSPWIHARFAALTGQNLRYGKRLVALDRLAQGLRAFRAEGGKGCSITVPFKFEAAALATRASPRALLAQASNTLRFDAEDEVFADNTDGLGLVSDIQTHAGVAIAGRELLLLGAGGAAAGVLGPLIQAGPSRIVVANRTFDKAAALVTRHAAWAAEHGVSLQAEALDSIAHGFDIVINGTASSLQGAAPPVPASALRPGALACDMMYGAAAHRFMAWAREHGANPRDGLGMLVEQAAEAFVLWRGVRPPAAQVLAELRTRLGPA